MLGPACSEAAGKGTLSANIHSACTGSVPLLTGLACCLPCQQCIMASRVQAAESGLQQGQGGSSMLNGTIVVMLARYLPKAELRPDLQVHMYLPEIDHPAKGTVRGVVEDEFNLYEGDSSHVFVDSGAQRPTYRSACRATESLL